MSDTDSFTDLEILAMTLIGESESLGEDGMTGTACTIMNRVAANKTWLGGANVRDVCLRKGQYDCWWPDENNSDRQRILLTATQNPLYGPYTIALRISGDAMGNRLADVTNGAVSYYDSDECAAPYWAVGKNPCAVVGARNYYNLAAIEA